MLSPMSWTRRAFLGRAAAAAAIPAAVVAAVKIGDSTSPAKAGASAARRGTGSRRSAASWTVSYENSLAGYPNWRIANQGPLHAIGGYAGQASVRPGEPIDLYVSTTAREFKVKAFRMGWYKRDLARLVWQTGWIRGHRQAPARFEGSTRTVAEAASGHGG